MSTFWYTSEPYWPPFDGTADKERPYGLGDGRGGWLEVDGAVGGRGDPGSLTCAFLGVDDAEALDAEVLALTTAANRDLNFSSSASATAGGEVKLN